MNLVVVIVNYRSADLTIDCLRSLQPELAGIAGARVVVTDNLSPDDSVSKLLTAVEANRWENWVTIQPLPRNGGFAYGNNAAIAPLLAQAGSEVLRRAGSSGDESGSSEYLSDRLDYVLLLNPDTVIRPGAVTELLRFMENHPNVGIAGSRLEDPDGTPQTSSFRFHSIAGEFERGIRMGFVTKLLASRMIAPAVQRETGPCDWVAGASMIVRRAVFETAGLMDEKYFMYFEEVDFCLAAARAGWPCWYVRQSRVVHLVGAVSQMSDNRKHRKRRPAYWFDSRRRYFVKNHGRAYAVLADAAFLVAHTIWRMRRFVQRKEDTDPPKLLTDSVTHSVFFRGFAT